jgi:hypothetical protein
MGILVDVVLQGIFFDNTQFDNSQFRSVFIIYYYLLICLRDVSFKI